jgi:hypothetical protein
VHSSAKSETDGYVFLPPKGTYIVVGIGWVAAIGLCGFTGIAIYEGLPPTPIILFAVFVALFSALILYHTLRARRYKVVADAQRIEVHGIRSCRSLLWTEIERIDVESPWLRRLLYYSDHQIALLLLNERVLIDPFLDDARRKTSIIELFAAEIPVERQSSRFQRRALRLIDMMKRSR